MTIDMDVTQTAGDKPDPEGTAQRLLETEPEEKPRRGRPKGRTDSRPRRKAGDGPGAASPERIIDTSPPTEGELAAFSMLWSVLWSLLAVRLGNLTDITDPERRALASATVPVFRKYAPALGGWEAEFSLFLVVSGVVVAHMPAPVAREIAAEDVT